MRSLLCPRARRLTRIASTAVAEQPLDTAQEGLADDRGVGEATGSHGPVPQHDESETATTCSRSTDGLTSWSAVPTRLVLARGGKV
jgi:hypothetical protein